jgi:UDP-N-acetylmuramate dehydrogenase
MNETMQKRKDKQPLDYPSAGSVFKRPEGHFAGALIEQCGLKGKGVGGARVSEKHAGFIVNAGGATAADVRALIALVQTVVEAETGVFLEPEIRFV